MPTDDRKRRTFSAGSSCGRGKNLEAECRKLRGGKLGRKKGTRRELRDDPDTITRTYGKVGARGLPEAEGKKASAVNASPAMKEVARISQT